MRKKTTAGILAVSLAAALAVGCGAKSESESSGTSSVSDSNSSSMATESSGASSATADSGENGDGGTAETQLSLIHILGSERRETVRSLSGVGGGYLRGAVLSTRGPGWTDRWCTG